MPSQEARELKMEITEEQRQEFLKKAAKEFFEELSRSDQDINNMWGYIRERTKELDCSAEYPEASKSLRLRYNLQYKGTPQIIFAILEDWFKMKLEQQEKENAQ